MASSALERHETLWIHDGNIVLRAENRLFRTYGAQLARVSSVSRDMFAVPQPPTAGAELYDGMPVIVIHDLAFDVVEMLMAIHEVSYAESAITSSFAALISFLRMGTKYDIKPLRAIAVKRLHVLFPSTVHELREANELRSQLADAPDYIKIVIELALPLDIPEVLPCAFWMRTPNGSDELVWQSAEFRAADGQIYSLSPSSVLKCVRGAWALADRFRQCLKEVLECSPECTTPNACSTCFMYELRQSLQAGCELDMFLSWHNVTFLSLLHVCIHCLGQMMRTWDADLEKAWKELPPFFDLPS